MCSRENCGIYADKGRCRYKLAEKLSDRLGEMGKDLASMIEEINDASSNLSKTSKSDDPVSNFVRAQNIVRMLTPNSFSFLK